MGMKNWLMPTVPFWEDAWDTTAGLEQGWLFFRPAPLNQMWCYLVQKTAVLLTEMLSMKIVTTLN